MTKLNTKALTAEIREINIALGWRCGKDCKRAAPGWSDCAKHPQPTFDEAMMLLVSEMSEASDAWRKWGLEDKTDPGDPAYPVPNPKPEGVGSEFADIAIRLLDDCSWFGVDLMERAVNYYSATVVVPPSPLEAMFELTKLAAKASEYWHDRDTDAGMIEVRNCFTLIWLKLQYFALMYSVDLDREIRRKMDFNRTREFRHGGRRL